MENQDLENCKTDQDVKQPKIKKKDFENVRKMLKSYAKFNMDKYKELIGLSSSREKKKEIKNKAAEEDQFLCLLSSKIKVIGDHYLNLKVSDELVELTNEEKYLLSQFYLSEQTRLMHTALIVKQQDEAGVVSKWREDLEKSFQLLMKLKDEKENWIFYLPCDHDDHDDKECQDLYLI